MHGTFKPVSVDWGRERERARERAVRTSEMEEHVLDQWYSTFFVRAPPDIISLQLCTPKVVGV
jgi:hypothetical protein